MNRALVIGCVVVLVPLLIVAGMIGCSATSHPGGGIVAADAASTHDEAPAPGRGVDGGGLPRHEGERIRLAQQEISYTIEQELANAREAMGRNDYAGAQAAVERARVARNLNPQIYSESENRRFQQSIDQSQLAVNSADAQYRAQQSAKQQSVIQQEISVAQRRATADPAVTNLPREGARPEELWIVPTDEAVMRTRMQAEAELQKPSAYRAAKAKPPTTRLQDVASAQAAIEEAVIPGSGSLMTRLRDSQTPVPVPLKHTDVKASIAGYVATVDVTQQYHNPYSGKIEAVYVFPLPANAAVNEFLMTIGERKIRGIIRERAEAEQIYKAARAQGHVASLMTQERPNVFTQSVANIEPGKQIDVNVKYFHTLEYVDGWYEYVFPMVVGPRFNPPGYSEGIGAAGRGDRGASGQAKEVQYLRPSERSGHDISLTLDIDAGVTVEKFESRNHKVKIAKRDEHVATVQLDDADKIPNKDFVLRYKVAGDRVKSAVMAQRDAKSGGGHFTLMLFPPETLKELPRKPLEMVFTLDVSGSMSGQPIEQSKAAIRYALKNMRPDDTFNVVRFAGASEQMAPGAVPANRENVSAALQYIESMQAGGGTMMIEGIRRSLAVSPGGERLRFVAFLTDGYIGNEPEILREIHQLRQNTRIFSFGVGSSPNRYLLDHMAKFGAGCAAYLSLNDNADTVMADYFERIAHPALTDLAIDWGRDERERGVPAQTPGPVRRPARHPHR